MTIIRREIVIALVDDVELEQIGIEVTVPDGMTVLEAVGLMEIAKQQHLASKQTIGPTVWGSAESVQQEVVLDFDRIGQYPDESGPYEFGLPQ